MSKVQVVPYDPNWPKMFEQEASSLREALGDQCLTIHHIGSTSVPGLCAKPQIDIIVVVKPSADVQKPLEDLGYVSKGELNIPFKRYFNKPGFNMHVFEDGHPEVKLNLMFRDYLREHPDMREQYGALKKELASQKDLHQKVGKWMTGYTLGKDKLIKEIIEKTGFNELCLRFCTHHDEWEAARRFRQRYIFDPMSIKDPYTWSFDHMDHSHCVFYQGAHIVGYVHIQFWADHRAALRIIAIDEHSRHKGVGAKLIKLYERWLRSRSIKSLHIQSSQEALGFYIKQGYASMPFDDPDQYESDPCDVEIGKMLL